MAAISVLIPFLPVRPEQVAPYARLVRDTHASRLWQGQGLAVESHQSFAQLAGAGLKVPTGLGVVLMPLRHPYEAALQARSVALATGHPVVAGYGPGAAEFQRAILGRPYQRPLTAAREYITIVRNLLDGRDVQTNGEVFSCHSRLVPCTSPRVDVGVGVLRAGMAELAGRVGDVAITWLTPAAYLRDLLVPAMRKGAHEAGRPPPRVTAIVPVALATRDRNPAEIVLAGNGQHFQGHHYRDMLRRAGIDLPPVGNRATTAKAVVEGGAFIVGDADELVARLAEYTDAGVDEVVLNVSGVRAIEGDAAALGELRTLLRLLQPASMTLG